MREQILEIITRACGKGELGLQTELIDSEILDSLGMITLIFSLEDELGIEIQPTQMSREVWRTPASIVEAVLAAGDIL